MGQNKTLIFTSSHKHFPELRKIVRGIDQNIVAVLGPEVVIEDIPADLRDIILFRTFEEYEVPKHSCRICAEEALRLIKKWGYLKIDEKRSFEDLTSYKTIYFWRIYDNALLLYYLADMVYYIKIISSVLEEERPSQLILVGSEYNIIEAIFFEIAKQREIPVRRDSAHKVIRVALPVFPIALERSFCLGRWEIRICVPFQPYIWALFLKNVITGFLGKVYNLGFKEKTSEQYRNVLFYSTNKKQLDSVIPLVRELQRDIKNRVLVIDWFWKSGDAVGLLREENIPHRVFDGYITWGISKSLWKRSQNFLRSWRLIENNKSFQRSLTYEDLFMWDLVCSYLKDLFLRHFVKMSNFFEVAKRIVDVERPDIIVVTNERQYTARLSVMTGKFKGIPSLELQRGAIADVPNWEGPLYTDKMVVDGKFARQVLVMRGVAPEKLIIAGNPRYDIIKGMDIGSATRKIYKQLGLNMDKKLIFLTTMFVNPYEHLGDKKRLLRVVFSSVKKFPECHLVVKLHPAELTDRLHRDIAKRVGIENISIVKDVDIWELIASCQILITAQSTTGTEAILMDKPLISVNLSRIQKNLMPYAESGAAIGVYQEEDIEGAIRDILSNKIIGEKLKIARGKFISEHLEKFDGQATKRIAKIITDMTSQKAENQ